MPHNIIYVEEAMERYRKAVEECSKRMEKQIRESSPSFNDNKYFDEIHPDTQYREKSWWEFWK